MQRLEVGLIHVSRIKVTDELLACNMGSGDLRVLATPAMIALMENAAMLCLSTCIEQTQSTVGISINATHTKATALGSDIEAVAKISGVDGRKITFSIIARDGEGVIGEASHERFIVDRQKFMAKL